MFTVLIAEKEHIDAIKKENKLFFEPFLSSKELAFCYWNPSGQCLADAVPELRDAVGRRREWRAVIINNNSRTPSKLRNPFDTVEHSELDAIKIPDQQPAAGETQEHWEDSWKEYFKALAAEKEQVYKRALERPLQKLSTWLCFRPENYIHNEVSETQDVHDWAMEMISKDEVKSGVKLEILEREYSKFELRLKDNLRREFVGEEALNLNYPSEVYCISPRAAENNYFDPDAFWSIHHDSQYSKFADRNMYFDKMRFMVCDVLSPAHRDFRSDYIRFLATVLIFISNPVPGSAMQARRLYLLEVESDDKPLCTLVTSYDKKLYETFNVIDNEMERITSEIPDELTDKAAEALFCNSKEVAVLLDESCNTEAVFADRDYGLFFDSPQNEFFKWNKDHQKSKTALAYITKQQSRAVRKSVNQMHAASVINNFNVSRLTPYQIEDVKDYTDAAEDTMVSSIPPDLNDISAYTKRMDNASDEVKKVINRRMTKKTGIILSAVCMGLYLLCFFPFLFSNAGTTETVITAIVLSASALLVLAVIMLIALFFMRASVLNAVKNYNDVMHGIMNDVDGALKRFSKYLSASASVRKGHAVQNFAKKNLDEYTRGLRIRKKHQEDIRRRRAYLAEEYGDYLRDRSYCDEAMSRPYDYDFDETSEFPYPAPFLAGDYRQIEFISTGNFVTVPLSYVTRILVRMEGIYE